MITPAARTSMGIMILGEGEDFKFTSITNIASDAKDILKKLFALICQTSETPEFILGTAVESSRASVSEQMPAMVKKANRKQQQFADALLEMIKLRLKIKHNKNIADYKVELIMPDIVDEDRKINSEIAKILLENEVITAETAAKMTGISAYIDTTVEEEVKKAKNEGQVKSDNDAKALGLVVPTNRADEELNAQDNPKDKTNKETNAV